jgi:hypothetical protein
MILFSAPPFSDVHGVIVQMVDDSVDFKIKVDEVLKDTGFSDARPAKMTIDDLLKCVSIHRE